MFRFLRRLWNKITGRGNRRTVTPPRPARPTATPIILELEAQYELAVPESSEWRHTLSWYVSKINRADPVTNKFPKNRYYKVFLETGVPWEVVACIHALESGFKWNRHLHNGDPLSAKTVRVPAGRGPFDTWEESATDALMMKKNIFPQVWTVGATLDFLERYNGLGYRNKRLSGKAKYKNLYSPYLWSGCEVYKGGKYVRDGVFSMSAKSKQLGAGLLLRALGYGKA